MKVLVTGASGFIGGHLCAHLVSRGHQVTAVVRRESAAPPDSTEVVVGDIGPSTPWGAVLAGHDAVIHLAARVHVMHDGAEDPLEEFRVVNVEGTRQLALSAREHHVRRFIFLSSIKVHGEETVGVPFDVEDIPDPVDDYGVSKLEAEVALREVFSAAGDGLTIVRTPLVYGPGVGGNFNRMMRLAVTGWPLPLRSINNRRTMVSVWNLVDLIEKAAIDQPIGAAVVLAGDATSASTPDLLQSMRKALGMPSRLFPFPVSLLRLLGRITGQSSTVHRLVSFLEVTPGGSQDSWNWRPPIDFDEAIIRTMEWYRDERRKA